MGPLSYLLLFSLTICRTNGLTIAKPSMSMTVSSSRLDSDPAISGFNPDPDFSALQDNTIPDLGLRLVQKTEATSTKNCYTACKTAGNCVRSVYCNGAAKCPPGHFCMLGSGAGTCYLSGHSGESFQPTGTCTISKEVKRRQSGIPGDIIFTDEQLNSLFDPFEKNSIADELSETAVGTAKNDPEREKTIDTNKVVNLGCLKEPTIINHGVAEKRRLERPGYPVVIEYECDQDGEDEYKYLAGSREAVCDDQGNWTLPAMICIPSTCYLVSSNGAGHQETWYVGDKDHTADGIQCQRWTEYFPHDMDDQYSWRGSFPGEDHVADGKCRDLDRGGRPWCYTMDPKVRWDVCDVPKCREGGKCGRPPYIYGTKPVNAKMIGRELHVTYECQDQLTYESGGNVSTCDMETGEWVWSGLQCYSKECFFYEREVRGRGIYQGDASTTVTGKTCQRWDSQSPHDHHIKASYFPVENLAEAGNLCRDFVEELEGAPWCYTADPDTRWEFCNVTECNFK